jgi:hypothetical protein
MVGDKRVRRSKRRLSYRRGIRRLRLEFLVYTLVHIILVVMHVVVVGGEAL